ncbi:16S rRNA (cytosine(1402)-N(4))-methyltransferase RsmH [candidate division WOR-3 bacterium]|nr:16S rRNA (cytosine(1402)-N(4))-methyltransferase RsmH [candidate division WOR-3 bacterium]
MAFLHVEEGGVFVDCTTGTGGHSQAILRGGADLLIGFDLDIEQLVVAQRKLLKTGGRFILVKSNYAFVDRVVKVNVDGVLIDAGVSTYQMEESRGFSFRKGGVLDMRFNRETGEKAVEFINRTDVEELAEVLKNYGDLKHPYGIARRIKENKIRDVEELTGILRRTFRREKAHKEIAKVFQALRIKVNRELENLSNGVKGAYRILKRGGRLVVITYHSGEERVVLKTASDMGFNMLTKKPLRPDKKEFEKNPRSRSAKLRAFEK